MIKKLELYLLVVLILLKIKYGHTQTRLLQIGISMSKTVYQPHVKSHLSEVIPTEKACQIDE